MYTKILDNLLHKNKVLVACHQGSAGGNIAYNTYRSMLNAINQGAHIVEFDISRSKDGVFHVFHENEEPIRFNRDGQFRTFTAEEISNETLYNMNMQGVEPPNTLDSFMRKMSIHQNTLLHFDHAQKWGIDLLRVLDSYSDQIENIIIKTDASAINCLDALAEHTTKYMTLVKIWNQTDYDNIMAYKDKINIVGFEMCFSDANEAYVSKENLKNLRDMGYHTMVNALVLWNDKPSICGGFDDDISLLEDPNKGWGVLFDMGFDIIQSDWPLPLKVYLESKGVNFSYE